MGLQMANATYGRDSKGLKELKNNILGDIDKACKDLKSPKYDQFIKTVQTNWSGTDSEKFVQNFKASVNEIEKVFKSYRIKVENALNADAKQFKAMQSNNANTIVGNKPKIS